MNRFNGWGYRAEDSTISPVSTNLANEYASALPSPVSPVAPMVLSSIPAPHALAGHSYPKPLHQNHNAPSRIPPPAANFRAPEPRLNQVADAYNPYYYSNVRGHPQPHLPLRKTSAQRLRLNTAVSQDPSRMPPFRYPESASAYQHPQPPLRRYADLPSNPYQHMPPDHYQPTSSHQYPTHPPSVTNHHEPYARPRPAEVPAHRNMHDNAFGIRPGTSPFSSNERRWNGPAQPSNFQPSYHSRHSPPQARQPERVRKMPSVPDKMAATPNHFGRNHHHRTFAPDRGPTHASYLNLVQPETHLFPDESSGESRSQSPSNFDTSGTERSSVLTKASSFSDHNYTPPPGGKLLGHQKSISVEEYISMYEDGFDDFPEPTDAVPEPLSPSRTLAPARTPSFEWKTNQMRHERKPITDFDRSLPPTPPTKFPTNLPPFDEPHKSIGSKANNASQSPPKKRSSAESQSQQQANLSKKLPRPPAMKLLKPVARDRYGFKKRSQNVSETDYDTWNSSYTGYLERRKKKWEALMKSHGLSTVDPYSFPPRSDKVQRYIRKGIPPEWRGAAWFWYAGGPESLANSPDLYASVHRRIGAGALSDLDREHIERDLNRTFPDNKRFKPDPSVDDLRASAGYSGGGNEPETPILQALRRVLQAFAVHSPDIGYCQSLNFIAGLLLLFLDEDEEKVFTMLNIITKNYLPGTHGIVLANADVAVLMTLIRESMPAVWSKINDLPPNADLASSTRLPTVSLATTSWFMSCFIGTLPIESVLRVWDILFYEGSKTLFRVGLAVFKSGERSIKAVTDPLEVFQVVQSLPRGLIDVNGLLALCYGKKKKKRKGGIGNGHVSQEVIDERRIERKRMHAEERTRMGK